MSKSDVYVLSHSKLDDLPPYERQTSQMSSVSSSTYDRADYRAPDGIDIKLSDSNTATSVPFRGMGKEELLQHSGKPFWRRLRMLCVSIILIGWLALIITVVALVLIYPKCKSPENREWWQKEVLYRVYIRSFKDSNNDGIGDIKGLTSKLDHIKDLGVGGISLSSIYMDDGEDGDYSIINHQNIDPDLGTIQDFRNLINTAHTKGLKVILDFIPNYTSDKHEWFTRSIESKLRNNTYRNYYVWTDTPTNWRTVYDQSAWNISSPRQQYYLHQFLEYQPDLNLRSARVQQELEDILKFWLGMEVDGFYVRDSAFMFEDYDMRDEEMISNTMPTNEYNSYDHKFTYGLPEVNDMLSRWRHTLRNYTDKILIADIEGDIMKNMDLYGYFVQDGVQISLNRRFLSKSGSCDGACVKKYVNDWLNNLPTGRWANWMIDDDRSERFASRFNVSYIRAFYMATMLLPGTPIIYYGDEINMKDLVLTQTPEKWSRRQSMRGLMQWENATNAGFCNSTCTTNPWIGVGSDFQSNNVENQVGDSMMTFIKNLTTLRKESSFQIGEFHQALTDNDVYSYVREFDGEKGYLVAINFGPNSVNRNFVGSHSTILKTAKVVMTTGGNSGFSIDDEVDTSSLSLGSHEGIVVSWDYVAKEL